MQRTRVIPVAWLGSGLCPDRPKGWIPIILVTVAERLRTDCYILGDKKRQKFSPQQYLFIANNATCFGIDIGLRYTGRTTLYNALCVVRNCLFARVFLSLTSVLYTVKYKQSRNRPGVAQRVPGGLGSQILRHSAHEVGEVVNLTHGSPLPPGMFLVLFFTRGWVDPRAMIRSEGNMSLKNPVTSPGIDPGTVRLVAQRLNHYATPGPIYSKIYCPKIQ